MIITEPQTPEEFERYYDLRWRVLRAPWNQPRGSERSGDEATSIHVMACEADRMPLAVGRANLEPDGIRAWGRIRYMAVEPSQQGKGVGGLVLQALERRATENGVLGFVLDARQAAVPFYEKHGYRVVEKSHLLFGEVQHFRMMKRLTP